MQSGLRQTQGIGGAQPDQIDRGTAGGHRLGNDRRNGCSFHIHAQHGDTDVVSDNIEDTSHALKDHRVAGIAQRPDHTAQKVIHHHRHHTDHIDPQIKHSLRHDILRRSHGCKKQFRSADSEEHQDKTTPDSHQKHGLNQPVQTIPLLCAKILCCKHAGSHRHSGEKSHQTGDDQTAGAHRRRSLCAKKLSHKHQIHGGVELLDQTAS